MKPDRSSRAKSTKLKAAANFGLITCATAFCRTLRRSCSTRAYRTYLPSYTSSSAPPRATAFFTRPPAIQCSSIPWMKSGRTHLPRATQWAASSIRR